MSWSTSAGGTNIFADIEAPSAPVSLEAIAARDPDLILTVTRLRPRSRHVPSGAWCEPSASGDSWCCRAPSSPGRVPRAPDAIRRLAAAFDSAAGPLMRATTLGLLLARRARRAGASDSMFGSVPSGPAGVSSRPPRSGVHRGHDPALAPSAARAARVLGRRGARAHRDVAPGAGPESAGRSVPARAVGRRGARCRARDRRGQRRRRGRFRSPPGSAPSSPSPWSTGSRLVAGRRLDPRILLLAGVVVSAFTGAVMAAVLTLVPSPDLRNAFLWLLGGLRGGELAGAGASSRPTPSCPAALLVVSARNLDLLSLGEEPGPVSSAPTSSGSSGWSTSRPRS